MQRVAGSKTFRLATLGLLLSFSIGAMAFDQDLSEGSNNKGDKIVNGGHPKMPNPGLTQGSLCSKPTEYRYPEHIPYCERNVNTNTKKAIIADYENLGYDIASHRADFKIDHYFPLCAGGSNEVSNLWPQHKSVYTVTDPLEQEACAKMAEGKLSQKDAIDLFIQAKSDLSKVPGIRAYVKGL